MLKIFLVALLCIPAVTAAEFLNMTLMFNFTRSAGTCTVDEAATIIYDNTRNFLITNSLNDDTLTILNASNPALITCVGSVADAVSPNSLDSVRRMDYDETSTIVYAAGETDSDISLYNTTPATPTPLSSLNNATYLGNTRALSYSDVGGTRFLLAAGTSAAAAVLYNVTVPSATPVYLSNFNASVSPCSIDGTFQDKFTNHTSTLILGTSATDDGVTILNLTTNNNSMECLDSHADSAGVNSTDGLRYTVYDPNGTIMYTISPTDGNVIAWNISDPRNMNYLGEIVLTGNQPVDGDIKTIGGTRFLFIGDINPDEGIVVLNVTNPLSITQHSVFNTSSGGCAHNSTVALAVHDNYLFTGGGTGNASCIYSIKLYDPAVASDSCTYTSGDHTYVLEDNCVISTSVNAAGSRITLNGSSGSLTIASGGILTCKEFLYTPANFDGNAVFGVLNGGRWKVEK